MYPINENCGALHPSRVAAEVIARGGDVGLTFDGDADRCMLAGPSGKVINGDAILLMTGRDLKARGMLTGDVVVATTMSNMGLEAALKRSGIRMLRAPVGDRYVLERMQKEDAALELGRIHRQVDFSRPRPGEGASVPTGRPGLASRWGEAWWRPA